MFKLEKIFQQDDNFFINITIFLKSFLVYLSLYIYSILESNSIYDLLNYDIYKTSKYFYLSLYFSIFYLIFAFIFRVTKKRYVVHFLSFLLNDIVPLLVTAPFTFYILFIFKINFLININTLYLFLFILFNLFITRKILDQLYENLMSNNSVQKNIMLVGSIDSIQTILKENKHKIFVYKCCLIKDDNQGSFEKARMSLKIPVFTDKSEMRIILEYHELGQIWILDNDDKNLVNYFLNTVMKFSVDIIIVNLKNNFKNRSNLLSDNVINNKYSYSNYQTSKFFGINLLIKIFLDKILAILFLIIVSPVLILVIICIYLEDGLPILFSVESAGWDGRRFNVHKFRLYKKNMSNKQSVINKEDKIFLKIGKFIKKFRINEFPQFLNIIKGDMSIVGPRPHILKEDLVYAKVFKQFLKRNKSAPGLTGLAQVNGYSGEKPSNESMQRRMEYDLWYMNNWNVWLDLFIILKTFYIIFTKPKR